MKKFGSAIILAGGKGSRMGFDKQFLKINDKNLMDILISELEKEFDEIIIISNKPEEYVNFKYKVAPDIIEKKGPLSGIHAGLTLASSDFVFVIACDMPNIDLNYIRYMKDRIIDNQIDGCVTQVEKGIEPFHGFYSRSIIGDIEKYLKDDRRSIYKFLEGLNIIYIDEKELKNRFSENLFVNLNTVEELENYICNEES